MHPSYWKKQSEATIKHSASRVNKQMNDQDQSETKPGRKPNGRPPKYTDPDILQERVNSYFEECDANIITQKKVNKGEVVEVEHSEPYTMAGLAHHLGLSRETLNQYKKSETYAEWQKEEPEKAAKFLDIITHARDKIERDSMARGLLGIHDSRISTLNLSSNYGYSSKVEQDIKAKGTITIIKTSYKGASGINFNPDQQPDLPNATPGDAGEPSDPPAK